MSLPWAEILTEVGTVRGGASASKRQLAVTPFWRTRLTPHQWNGGTLEKAREMVNHANPRTTQLYDRR